MRVLGTHCPLLEECDLGHQIGDDEFTTSDVLALLEGCPSLEILHSQNGFQMGAGDCNLLNALRTGPYKELEVPIGLRSPLRDMDDVIGGFVENPGKFEGTLSTFPYCWNDPDERRTDEDLVVIAERFDANSEALMERACRKGFSLHIVPMDWFD
jgi:hypothetical protein